ncbi:MAG: tetraacyldisaccharide 4'-kinase [Terriglobales bacterium]
MNPLTGLYGAAVALRNALFDRGILPSRRLAKPVISVGNLAAGGAGKTPFVIALGELLQARAIPFDVLSRGYRRRTRGVLVVDPEGAAADFGDEPLLIARRLGVPVIVGENRYRAGQLAEQKFRSQLHILDDGFQHRSLHRDFDIVLMTAGDLHDRLLPLGRLREPVSSLKRADAVVLAQDDPAEHPALQGRLVWRMKREILLPSVPSNPVVFCGIARPQPFFAQLRAADIAPAAEVVFRDHHAYDQSDIQRLLAMRRDLGSAGFLTTEKDAVNLGPWRTELEPVAIVMLKLTLDRPADLVDTILATIAERRPRS